MPPSKKAPTEDLRFEDAIERLEEIIGRMETEQIPLDDLLKEYEEGTRLLKLCRERIGAARARVEKINKDLASGGARAENIDPQDGAEEEGATPADDPAKDPDEEEIQLL